MPFKRNHAHLKTNHTRQAAKCYVDTQGARIVGHAGGDGYRLDLPSSPPAFEPTGIAKCAIAGANCGPSQRL